MSEMFVLALVAISFIGVICVLLVQKLNLGNTASPSITTPPPSNGDKRIANYSIAFGAGLTAIVFAAQLVPIQPNWVYATILLVGGLAVIILSWIAFVRIR